MKEFLKDKMKYLREPVRLRVHVGYVLILVLTFTAKPTSPLFLIGTAMIFAALPIRAWASGIVKKDEELAVEGPYSLCRHPLYVGNILIGFGFCFINGAAWAFVAMLLYLAVFYPMEIRKESRKMDDFFGEEYQQYKDEVPLLIPRLTPYETLGGWSFEQYFYENKDIVNEGIVFLCWVYTLTLFLRLF